MMISWAEADELARMHAPEPTALSLYLTVPVDPAELRGLPARAGGLMAAAAGGGRRRMRAASGRGPRRGASEGGGAPVGMCALKAAGWRVADDVIGDVSHGLIQVVTGPGLVIGQRDTQRGAGGLGHDDVLSRSGTTRVVLLVQTPRPPGTERCRDRRENWHPGVVEQATLQRARAGDEQAFRELTDPYRRELQVHCYRMLGSLTDAEDMLQETLLAAWRGLAGFQERSSLRSWLYRIATNQCLNALRAAGRRIPAEPVPPFQPPEPTRRGEITWLQPYPDVLLEGIADTAPGPDARYQASEAIELAFIAGLQRLPSRQAAALVLRDVLGFATHEVASMLGTSQTAVKGTPATRPRRAGPAPRPSRPHAGIAARVGHRTGHRPPLRRRVHRRRHQRRGRTAHRRHLAVHAPGTAPVSRHRRRPVVPASQLRLPRRPPRVPGAHRRQHPARPGQLPQRSCPACRHPGRTIRTHHGQPEDPGHHPFPPRRALPAVRTGRITARTGGTTSASPGGRSLILRR